MKQRVRGIERSLEAKDTVRGRNSSSHDRIERVKNERVAAKSVKFGVLVREELRERFKECVLFIYPTKQGK